MNIDLTKNYRRAARAIDLADTILIAAGAGMGVDSGLPDFRGKNGFWKTYPVLGSENISFEQMANPDWFIEEPRRAWGFYGERLNLYRATKPHSGFSLLKKWCNSKEAKPFVFTSNVDGHFQKAGFNSKQIYECHGSINYLQCVNGCEYDIWEAQSASVNVERKTLTALGELPSCRHCGAIARPNILMFDDWGWIQDRAHYQRMLFGDWIHMSQHKKIVTIEIGAGTNIPTVRNNAEILGSTLIRINPRDFKGGENVISLPVSALEALTKIDACYESN